MRVLVLSRYSDRAASHFRFYQYARFLAREGIELIAAPLFGPYYLESILDGARKRPLQMVIDYLRRFKRVLSAGRYDLVWLQEEAFPWLPAAVEALLSMSSTPYVVDYDDAWFHRYNLHPNPLVARGLGMKIDWVMRRAPLVLAGNGYIRDHARRAGAQWVECLPTVVDLDDYPVDSAVNNSVFTIGWLGSPSTSVYLRQRAFCEALRVVCRNGTARVVFVGSGPIKLTGVPFELHRWRRETEATEISTFHVGVSPMSDGPFERGKCGFKLVQYMAASRPVVASPVGFHRDLVDHGANGFFAETRQDWIDALMQLQCDPALRQRMGATGRKMVEDTFCVQATAPRLARLLVQAANG